jgi:hypothetical protein
MPTGTTLWRVHGSHAVDSFRSTGAAAKRADATLGREGRFDCDHGEFGYLYAGDSKRTAIAEAFLRDEVVRDPAARFLRRGLLDGRSLSPLTLAAPLELVDLRGGVALAAVGQDAWLTARDEDDYHLTQAWGWAIRDWAPGAAGMIWMARRDNLRSALVLFSDRVPTGAILPGSGWGLERDRGLTLVRRTLLDYNVTIAPRR